MSRHWRRRYRGPPPWPWNRATPLRLGFLLVLLAGLTYALK